MRPATFLVPCRKKFRTRLGAQHHCYCMLAFQVVDVVCGVSNCKVRMACPSLFLNGFVAAPEFVYRDVFLTGNC